MRRARVAATLAWLGAVTAAAPSAAWDTYVNGQHDWRSIYENPVGTGSHHGGAKATGNEHAEISDDILFVLGQKYLELFGTQAAKACTDVKTCAATPAFVDLNSSYMRPEIAAVKPWGDDPNTVLEERRLPPLAMWAGLPDFNYTVYDWINKGTRCPALPLSADRYELCHVYSAWLGAGLNSSHFGSLASKVYARHHAIAGTEAARAAALAKLLREGGVSKQLPVAGAAWHVEYVKEAELLALIYEMVGQHFLQDRWSSGHMFSRWGGGGYEDLPKKYTVQPMLDDVAVLGLLTGVVHGSLAVFGKPDPLSAPLVDYTVVGDDQVRPMTWRYSQGNGLYQDPVQSLANGVGDYYFADVVDDKFDASVLNPGKNQSISTVKPATQLYVRNQKKALRTCGGEGLRDVISAFDSQNGSFGAHQLSLTAPDPNETLPIATTSGNDPAKQPACMEPWVTNDAFVDGARTLVGATKLLGDGLLAEAVMIGKVAIESIPDAIKSWYDIPKDPSYTPPGARLLPISLIVAWKARKNQWADEAAQKGKQVRYGVQSAKDGIAFSYFGLDFLPNHQFDVPAYFEPEDVDELPWFSETTQSGKKPSGGRDRAAIDGFFNRARVQSWCKALYGSEKLDKKKAVTLKLLRNQALELEILAKKEKDQKKQAQLSTESKRARAACSYLAGRVYKSTDPEYKSGTRLERIGEHLPLDQPAKFGPTYEPVCAYFDDGSATDIRTTDAKDDDKPYYLRPGYVEGPGKPGGWGHAPKTLENWCEMIPVLDVGKTADDPDSVGSILKDDGNRWLKLSGENVGIKTGKGAVGQVVATNATGQKQSLDIWDGNLKLEKGGWSYDNQTVWARIPGSKRGFPSNATAGMLPHELKKLSPRAYDLELQRPDDQEAKGMYRADGRKSVGLYRFFVHTAYVEYPGISYGSGVKAAGFWTTYPKWIQGDTESEILVKDFFKVQGGVYTKIDLAALGVTAVFKLGQTPKIESDYSVTWVPDADKCGMAISHPGGLPSAVFDGTVSWVFAFH
ncbi:MAG: hypothetical protein IT377_22740 [Polyangiaceae bacterium]|nr:hypothetical protein [Polyangiaceae bacterium]